jgi:hypothetical protein
MATIKEPRGGGRERGSRLIHFLNKKITLWSYGSIFVEVRARNSKHYPLSKVLLDQSFLDQSQSFCRHHVSPVPVRYPSRKRHSDDIFAFFFVSGVFLTNGLWVTLTLIWNSDSDQNEAKSSTEFAPFFLDPSFGPQPSTVGYRVGYLYFFFFVDYQLSTNLQYLLYTNKSIK